jgi:hypothetical protein
MRFSAPALAVSTAMLVASGCLAPPVRFRPPAPVEISLPTWLTSPVGEEQREAPLLVGMRLPPELAEFGERYPTLPAWVLYGTVRCLGADEFLATGTIRRYTVSGESDVEYRQVVDTLRYHVDAQRVDAALAAAVQLRAAAKDEASAGQAMEKHLRYHHRGFALYSLRPEDPAAGRSEAVETFRAGAKPQCDPVGWRETAGEYRLTYVGDFRYSDPISAFRQTEEEAIAELARATLIRVSDMQKHADELREVTSKETLSVRIRGLRVVRRAVDLDSGTCFVTVCVPKGGAK